jgi:hypothetical protein
MTCGYGIVRRLTFNNFEKPKIEAMELSERSIASYVKVSIIRSSSNVSNDTDNTSQQSR